MKAFLALVLGGLLLSSCIYENDDVHVNPVEPPTGVGAEIHLNDVTDPISIYKPTAFTFSVSPEDKLVYEATIKVDGSEFATMTSGTGDFSFVLDPAKTGNGTKSLEISVTYRSLSPSLAGQLGLETLAFARTFTLVVDATPPDAIASPEVYIEDGKSMIKWNSPSKFTFSQLIIFRSYINNTGFVVATDSIKITDHHSTVFHDASYVGGSVKYRIDIKGYRYYVKGGETSFSIVPLTTSLNSMTVPQTISWSQSPLYGNDIYISTLGGSYPIDQPGSRNYNERLGQPQSYEYQVRAKHPPANCCKSPHEYTFQVSVYKGKKIPWMNDVMYCPSDNIYLLIGSSTIDRLDGDSFEVTGTYTFSTSTYRQFIYSQNGQHVYVFTAGEDKIYRFDPITMTLGAPINLTSIIGQANQGISSITSLSNDNFLMLQMGAVRKTCAVNLTSQTIVWQMPEIDRAVISPDSKYIYWRGAVYQNNNDNWSTLVGNVPNINNSAVPYFQQHDLTTKLGIIYYQTPTQLYDLSVPPDGMGLLTPGSTAPYDAEYDPHSNAYFSIQYQGPWLGDGIVYDAETMTQVRTIPEIYEPEYSHYVNGHFFYGYGILWP